MKKVKIQALKREYDEYIQDYIKLNGKDGNTMDFLGYIDRKADNDPMFFGWLFDNDDLTDRCSLNMDQFKEWEQLREDIAMTLVKLGPCDLHMGIRKEHDGFHVDAIDNDGNIHEDTCMVDLKSRKEVESYVRDWYDPNNVIFDY